MSQARWLGGLTALNKDRGNAPHKPLLLLVFLELVEQGRYLDGPLHLTPDLAYRFDTFFEVARHRRSARPNVRLPFHHPQRLNGAELDRVYQPHTVIDNEHKAVPEYDNASR